jgi:hypothetical protein
MQKLNSSFLIFIAIICSWFEYGHSQCSTEVQTECVSAIASNVGSYEKCDFCMCENFGSYAVDDDAPSCSGDEELYNCYLKVEDSGTFYCQLRLKQV